MEPSDAYSSPEIWQDALCSINNSKSMNHASQLFLSLILVSLLFCTFSWANDVCSDGAGYPDQYPFKNCGSVSTLTWDQANSCEELADNSSCTVAVAGGQGPYTWTISGTGFSFASGQTSIQTNENTVTVFTQDACGTATITISDECSLSKLYVRSTNGIWGPPAGIVINSQRDCVITGSVDSRTWNGYGWVLQGVQGKYKQEIYDFPYGYSASTTADCLADNLAPTCSDEESYPDQQLIPFCEDQNDKGDPRYNIFCFTSGDLPVTKVQFDDPNSCCNAFHPRPPQFIRCWQARIRRYYEWVCHY